MQQESFVELLEQLAGNSAELVRNEIALAKQEIRDELIGFRRGLLTVIIGLILMIVSFMSLIGALIIYQTAYLTPELSASVTGIFLLLIGIVIFLIGSRLMKTTPIPGGQSTRSVKETTQ